jgi:hypothetical protein
MCGLVGMAGLLDDDMRKAFRELLILDAVRGPHSTGVMSADVDGETRVLKRAVVPHDLLDMKQYASTVGWTPQVLMGHNRWATVGDVNNINAHPFEHGSVIGAHNGTLVDQDLLPDSHQFEVDSDNLIYAIDKIGVEEALKLTDGAFALTLYDKEDRTLQLVRNAERPLCYAYAADKSFVIWASEAWMIRAVMFRHNLKMAKNIHNLAALSLLTFELPAVRTEGIVLPRAKKVREWEKPASTLGFVGNAARVTYNQHNAHLTQTDIDYNKAPACRGFKRGDNVEFWPCGIETTANGSYYVEGIASGHSCPEIRIYMPQLEAVKMFESNTPFTADVSSIVQGFLEHKTREYSGEYMVLTRSTIAASDFENKDGNRVVSVTGPRGGQITPAAFEELTKHGCAACTADLEWDDAAITWDNDAAFCGDCELTQSYYMGGC